MQKTCFQCSATFVVDDGDRAFYEEIAPAFGAKTFFVLPPVLCPDCRHMRRMAFRNERNLYRCACDLTGEQFLSIYESGTPFPVYSHAAWWSDDWDALSYGRDYDQHRSFFEQFRELYHAVPRLGIVTGHNENCDYCNYTNYSKDSYLCFGCHSAQKCLHNWRVHWSESCVDCLQMDRSTLCYECVDCESCYDLRNSQDCDNCSDSAFLCDCKACRDCIGCVNLRNKQHCILNEQLDADAYAKRKDDLQLTSFGGARDFEKQWRTFLLQHPHRDRFLVNADNAVGDHIMNGKNLHECYHVKNAEDCRYLESCEEITSSMDNTFSGWPAERVFETMSAGVQCHNFLFCTACWSCSNLLYCDSCHHSSDLFGCIGLRKHNRHCILNKQYSEEEYERLAAAIIERMVADGEWSRFFPAALSPHAYNETVAQEFYPLGEATAKRYGYRWKTLEHAVSGATKNIPGTQLPETADDVPDDILQWVITCEATKRPYRIIKQELEFYRRLHLPVPRLHPDERHRRRMLLRNPRRLWDRACGKCRKVIRTTFAPERPEIVYCEQCYLKAVY
jgi:hypothetical protein